jgi:hypothetical protein
MAARIESALAMSGPMRGFRFNASRPQPAFGEEDDVYALGRLLFWHGAHAARQGGSERCLELLHASIQLAQRYLSEPLWGSGPSIAQRPNLYALYDLLNGLGTLGKEERNRLLAALDEVDPEALQVPKADAFACTAQRAFSGAGINAADFLERLGGEAPGFIDRALMEWHWQAYNDAAAAIRAVLAAEGRPGEGELDAAADAAGSWKIARELAEFQASLAKSLADAGREDLDLLRIYICMDGFHEIHGAFPQTLDEGLDAFDIAEAHPARIQSKDWEYSSEGQRFSLHHPDWHKPYSRAAPGAPL